MDTTHWLDHTLALVAERMGDPVPRIFERLFAESPALQSLFANDNSGAVRGEMFLRAVECLQDAAGAGRYGASLVAAEHSTHLGYGVSSAEFQHFFVLVVDVFRQALGPDWTPAIDQAWRAALQRVAVVAPA